MLGPDSGRLSVGFAALRPLAARVTARRRLLAVLAAGALALVGLAGCRSDPAVAAYVGSTQFTEAQVSQILDDARTKFNEERKKEHEERARAAEQAGQPKPGPPPEAEPPISRQDVVAMLVGRELLRAVAQRQGLSPVEIPDAAAGEDAGLPADAEYVKIYGEFLGYRLALVRHELRVPTEADLRDVYDRLRAASPATPSFEEWQAGLGQQNLQGISVAVTLREAITAEAAESDVVVNPRYRAELDLFSVVNERGERHPLVVAPLQGQPAPSSPVAGTD